MIYVQVRCLHQGTEINTPAQTVCKSFQNLPAGRATKSNCDRRPLKEEWAESLDTIVGPRKSTGKERVSDAIEREENLRVSSSFIHSWYFGTCASSYGMRITFSPMIFVFSFVLIAERKREENARDEISMTKKEEKKKDNSSETKCGNRVSIRNLGTRIKYDAIFITRR
ncbi:hypothetical protein KIN20_018407 [Parelaphostrongylus tenuis]|uniref:Uncharacterized protein n=1 Tax=Parelaphostrongylus tenuis TaxID=148309 RepID=A0AAD5MMZ3_PARTN|nr:hypothetical protein KIN20_018407 [Parelaphostrongylus tenuis]